MLRVVAGSCGSCSRAARGPHPTGVPLGVPPRASPPAPSRQSDDPFAERVSCGGPAAKRLSGGRLPSPLMASPCRLCRVRVDAKHREATRSANVPDLPDRAGRAAATAAAPCCVTNKTPKSIPAVATPRTGSPSGSTQTFPLFIYFLKKA